MTRYNDGSKSQKYICFARKQSRYMLGDKTGASYVVGFGPNFPQRPANRGASCPAPPENCTTVNGLYNPAPNPHVLTGALVMVRTQFLSWVLPRLSLRHCDLGRKAQGSVYWLVNMEQCLPHLGALPRLCCRPYRACATRTALQLVHAISAL